ncbi:GAF domain-containing sensor histidine kinase [Paenibacillus glycanilyticus]|uniref:histidine kinase n=1 Tax=Paenibacillus glycanilyticus TaxID=126569 RepID=A0ABQ6G4V2_9BACL|nr:GAF domain-containing sensor histidine kinase [Paenibacillus glycanilyticus]GLX65984.1 histidine kinase [Paenibacillus glycanilyticus]
MPREIRVNELTALKEIAEMLNSTNDMDQMLNDVLLKLLEVTDFTTGWIFLIDDDVPGNSCAAHYNLPPALTAGNYALMCGEDCWCVERYRQRKLTHAVNTIECKRITYAVTHQLGSTEGITHHATVPLKAGRDRFGLLNVAQAGKEQFTEEELALLQAIALQIGTAMNRIRLYQAQERNAKLYAKLGDVIQQINGVQDVNQLPIKAVQYIGDAFGWPNVSLFMFDGQQISLRASYSNGKVTKEWTSLAVEVAGPVSAALNDNRLIMESSCMEDSWLSQMGIPSYRSAAAIPLRVRTRTIGVLFISSPDQRQFEGINEDFMYSLGDHFTLGMENLRVYEHRSELARMEERNRMARDLHDSVIQKVFSLSFLAKGAENVLAGRDPVVQRSLLDIQQLSQEALKEMRTLIWQLHPAGLENGLLPALKQYGQGLNLTIYDRTEGVIELPRAIEEAFWRIGQEALNNVRKHSGTETAYIRLNKQQDGAAVLEIRDEGAGFKVERKKGRQTMGMRSMRERAEALGGALAITSGRGKPTIVRAVIPLESVQAHCAEEKGNRYL